MRFRNTAIAVVVALLLLVLAGKSLTMMIGAAHSRAVALERRQMRLADVRPSPPQLVQEIGKLDRALFWSRCDSDALYLKARNLHRLALRADEISRRMIVSLVGETNDYRDALLAAAIDAYDRALACNALVSGVRFWRLSAQLSRRGIDKQAWRDERKAAVQAALALDPQDAMIWGAAGDLALAHDDLQAAQAWHHRALALRLDDLEDIAAQWLDRVEGPQVIDEVIPRTSVARRRLAQFYFDEWLFTDARATFADALALSGKTPIRPPPDEAVSDGNFCGDERLLLHPWVIEPVRNVRVERLSDRRETAFLRASFHRGPHNWYHVQQRVPVEPGRRYRLTARVRIDGFTVSEQFGVEAVHPYAAELFSAGARCRAGRLLTEEVAMPVSAGRFVEIATEFDVPPGLRLVTIRLRRFGVGRAEKGIVDFSAVSLRPVADKEVAAGGES